MLNGLDLFSGIGGIATALAPWVRPVAYCEIDRYAQSVLLSRMAESQLPLAPIWDDVRTLGRSSLPEIDIITGGFPCQDISVAGNGAGLAGERSGLFFEIARLAGELRPAFIFLENVPAITFPNRGGWQIVAELTALGYDCRWCVISAAEVGANHKRERWFLLAYSNCQRGRFQSLAGELQKKANTHSDGTEKSLANTAGTGRETWSSNSNGYNTAPGSIRNGKSTGNGSGILEDVTNTNGPGREKFNIPDVAATSGQHTGRDTSIWRADWWSVEPGMGRMAHGVSCRVDRLTGLGNAVVPLQARTAFEILSGLRGIA